MLTRFGRAGIWSKDGHAIGTQILKQRGVNLGVPPFHRHNLLGRCLGGLLDDDGDLPYTPFST